MSIAPAVLEHYPERRVVETEVNVSLEKDDYILAEKADLLLGGDGKLELFDFKTSPRPRNSPSLIAAYERQLCAYARILERRHGRHVDRLLLYWTSEARREDAFMVLPYQPERVDEPGRHFDATVGRIRAGEFAITTPPEAAICRECDLRTLCRAEVAYRTRRDRSLPLTSDPHTYKRRGKHWILVKVIDIFGNDTSQIFEMEVK